MPETIAHRGQLAERLIERVGLGSEQAAIDPDAAAARKHRRDVLEREAGRTAELDQREALEHARVELPAKAAPADRRNEPAFLVEPQRRGGKARLPRYFGDVELAHALDFKWT